MRVLKLKYKFKSINEAILFVRKRKSCPFIDNSCPEDVYEKFPRIDAKSCCEYCVKRHFNDEKEGDKKCS